MRRVENANYNDMRALMDIQYYTKSCIFENATRVIDIHEAYRGGTDSNSFKIQTPYTNKNYLDVIESHMEELGSSNVIFTTDPSSFKDVCPKLKGKRAMHFSHSACEKVSFCHELREVAVGKWMQKFQEKCVQGK